MAASGFEGFEKRLELEFLVPGGDPRGLRLLPPEALREALDAVQCAVVSAAGNGAFDAYVLSESSLFVYPARAVLKTCGTTRLLRAVPVLLRHATALGLRLRSCRYSRGEFLFPAAQPFPHGDFADEVRYLDAAVPSDLPFRKSCVLPSGSSHSWHVYSASATPTSDTGDSHVTAPFTIEVCMTELDTALARQFYQKPGDDRSNHAIGDEMTLLSGIGGINPRSLVCGYAFAPCGYSMNSLDGTRYATVHVTPEDGHSYASYECVGGADALASIGKAVSMFRPSAVSVSVCYPNSRAGAASVWSAVAEAVEPLGLAGRSRSAEEYPGVGTVTYQTFAARSTEPNHDGDKYHASCNGGLDG